jgi:hypothetical protein
LPGSGAGDPWNRGYLGAPVAEAGYADSGIGLLDPADSSLSLYDPNDSSVDLFSPAGSGSGPTLVDASGVGRQPPVRRPDDRGPARPGDAGGPGRQTTQAPDKKSKKASRKNKAAAGAAAAGVATAAAASTKTGPAVAAATGVRAPSRPGQPGQSPSALQQAPAQPGVKPQPARQPSRTKGNRKSRRILSNRTLALAGASTVMAGAAFLILTKPSPSGVTQTHVLTTPDSLACYTKRPQLAQQMDAKTLQEQIVKQSSGAMKNVIYAVYENSTCGATVSEPQVVLFIGGNHTGTPGSFMSSFTGQLAGAEPTSAGSLGGEAACVPSVDGRPAECAWADNDKFGAVLSATLDESSLAKEMRAMRPLVEQSTQAPAKQTAAKQTIGKHRASTPSPSASSH